MITGDLNEVMPFVSMFGYLVRLIGRAGVVRPTELVFNALPNSPKDEEINIVP